MNVIVTSRHFKAHESLNAYAQHCVEGLGKYYNGIVKGDVVLNFEKPRKSLKIAEVNVSVYNAVLTGLGKSDDFFKSIDMAVEKVRVQLAKYKQKLRAKDRKAVRRLVKANV